MRDKIQVPIEQLQKGSCKKIKVKCDICGKIFERSYSNYLISNHNEVLDSIRDTCKKCCHSVASDVYKYFTGNPNGFLSNGNGLIVKDAGKDSKLTFFVSYVSSDGSYSGYTTFTYYDIGYTSNELLDNYVASL
jgi:hypothetical protein